MLAEWKADGPRRWSRPAAGVEVDHALSRSAEQSGDPIVACHVHGPLPPLDEIKSGIEEALLSARYRWPVLFAEVVVDMDAGAVQLVYAAPRDEIDARDQARAGIVVIDEAHESWLSGGCRFLADRRNMTTFEPFVCVLRLVGAQELEITVVDARGGLVALDLLVKSLDAPKQTVEREWGQEASRLTTHVALAAGLRKPDAPLSADATRYLEERILPEKITTPLASLRNDRYDTTKPVIALHTFSAETTAGLIAVAEARGTTVSTVLYALTMLATARAELEIVPEAVENDQEKKLSLCLPYDTRRWLKTDEERRAHTNGFTNEYFLLSLSTWLAVARQCDAQSVPEAFWLEVVPVIQTIVDGLRTEPLKVATADEYCQAIRQRIPNDSVWTMSFGKTDGDLATQQGELRVDEVVITNVVRTSILQLGSLTYDGKLSIAVAGTTAGLPAGLPERFFELCGDFIRLISLQAPRTDAAHDEDASDAAPPASE